LVLACGGGAKASEEPKVGSTRAEHAAPIAELPAEFRGQVSALQNSGVLGMLPETTMAAIVGKSPSHLASSLQFATILREYPAYFSEVNVDLNAAKTASLFDPPTWANIGIDVDAPFGAALVVHKRAVGLFFASLRHTETFLTNVAFAAEALRLGEVRTSTVAERHVLRFGSDDNVAIVVAAKSAILVVADRAADVDTVLAELLGSSDTPTLAQSGRLATSFTGFDYGEDIAGFIAFDTLAARIGEDQNRNSSDSYWLEQLETMEARVEEAKAQAKPQSEIDELEAKLATVLEQYNGRTLQESAEAHFTGSMLGRLGSMAFGIDLGGATTGVRLRVTPAPKSIADRLFVSGGGPLKSPKHLQEEPLWMLAGHVDRLAALEVFKTFINMEGETLGQLTTHAKEELQLDLNACLGLLGGEMSGAFTFNRDMLVSGKTTKDTMDAFGMHVMLEVRDEAAARALLLQAMQSPALQEYVSGTGDSAVLEIESFNNRPIRITIADGFLDARSVGPKQSTSPWRDHERASMGSAQNLALLVVDPLLVPWLLFSGSTSASRESHSSNSRANAELDAKLEEVEAKIDELRNQQGTLRNAAILKGGKALGRLVVTARSEPSGSLAIIGSLVGAASNLGRGVQVVAESFAPEFQELRTGKPSPLQTIKAELHTLQAERLKLWRLRY
tara:strand:+ start:19626 stop:21650 length:2025 start_codon:yes stop_codon:yes gene_type:complete